MINLLDFCRFLQKSCLKGEDLSEEDEDIEDEIDCDQASTPLGPAAYSNIRIENMEAILPTTVQIVERTDQAEEEFIPAQKKQRGLTMNKGNTSQKTVNMPTQCPFCGRMFDYILYPEIHIPGDSRLKKKVLNKTLFFPKCPHCGRVCEKVRTFEK